MITLNNSNIDFDIGNQGLESKYSITLSEITSNLIFKTQGDQRMTIMNNGNIGIGKSSTNYKLDVNGTINADTYYVNGEDISIITRDTSNYVRDTSNILVGRIVNTSNYVRDTSNILVGRVVDTSNYVRDTSNIFVGRVVDTSNYVRDTSNILVGRIVDTSNYVRDTSNILIGRLIDTSNYTRDTSNILVGRIVNTSNYVRDTSNILVGRIVDTSNYVRNTSNILAGRIVDTSNYVRDTSNILVGRIVYTSNYVRDTSNILVGRVVNTSNFTRITSNLFVGFINDTSNYVRDTSNIFASSISNTSNYVRYTSNILVGRVGDTSNYTRDTSNILVGRIVDTSNYVRDTCNILAGRIVDSSNYVRDTSNILVGRVVNTSNYMRYTSNILADSIKNKGATGAWITNNNMIYNNNSYSSVGIGTVNPVSRLHLYDNFSSVIKLTIQNNNITIQNNFTPPTIPNEISVSGITQTTVGAYKCIKFIYTGTNPTKDYNFTTSEPLNCDILIVGGGGGGAAGGGGGGGYLYYSNIDIFGNYTVKVGKGGTGANSSLSDYGTTDGVNSSFISDSLNYIAYGGEGGKSVMMTTPTNTNYIIRQQIGSSGGNTFGYISRQSPQGNIGGSATSSSIMAGGGGGVNSKGGDGISTLKGGDGGDGIGNNITGTLIYYAGGGTGGGNSTNTPLGGGGLGNGSNGTNETGGGGGGIAGRGTGDIGGKGGDGVVIMRYRPISSSTSIELINYSNITKELIVPNTTRSTSGLDRVISFPYAGTGGDTGTQTTYNISTTENLKADILLIGGGGSGAVGGGGGGGYVYIKDIIMDIGTYVIKVGNGGKGGGENVIGTQGYSSSIIGGSLSYIAYGGGGGGVNLIAPQHTSEQVGSYGGNGINGVSTTTIQTYITKQGNVGGSSISNSGYGSGGGGGGAGNVGGVPIRVGTLNYITGTIPYYQGGQGGNGLPNSITGSEVYYAGGGSGWANGVLNSYSDNSPEIYPLGGGGRGARGYTGLYGGNGTDGYGGGGGGARLTGKVGGNGGSGIVIIRYRKINTRYSIGNYNGDFNIISSDLDSNLNLCVLRINSDGNIGIGYVYPNYTLEVSKKSEFTTDVSNSFKYINNAGGNNNIDKIYICAKFNGNIWITSDMYCVSTSDIRTKEDIQDINDNYALLKILAIEPKTYKYIDKVEKGDNKVYGFIAQQIKKVIPEAISLENSYIPNIMLNADYYNNIITLPYLPTKVTINVKDKIKCFDINNNCIEVEVSKIINELEFEIKDLDKEYKNNRIFVYGTYVTDFHTLSKEHIFSLNVGATQELYRLIKKHDDIIKSREEDINALEQTNADLYQKYEMLLKELTLIKEKAN